MTFSSFIDFAQSILQQYSVIIGVAAIIFLLFASRKPKESFKFLLVLLTITALLYVVGVFRETVSTGTQNKDQMIYKTERLGE